MYRLTEKKIAPLAQDALRRAFDSLFRMHCTGGTIVLLYIENHLAKDNREAIHEWTVYCETESEDIYKICTIANIRRSWAASAASSPKNHHMNTGQVDSWENPIPESVTSWIGSDECGKGDYFGPLVTSAVMVDLESMPLLQKLHIRDSKDIPDKEIQSLASHIRVICDGKYSIISTMPERYNELMESDLCKGNSLWLLGWTHQRQSKTSS